MSRAEVFKNVYENGVWGKNIRSGEGSNPNFARPYVEYVRMFLERHPEVKVICDIGHGDWAMWEEWRFPNYTYIGVDVSPGLSEYAAGRYGSDTIRFVELDAVEEKLPDADLCLVKDVVIHLSDSDIGMLLSNLSKYRAVIVCSDIRTFGIRAILGSIYRWVKCKVFRLGSRLSDDIKTGGYHFVDLAREQYRLGDFGFRIDAQIDFIVVGDVFGRSTLKRIWVLSTGDGTINELNSREALTAGQSC